LTVLLTAGHQTERRPWTALSRRGERIFVAGQRVAHLASTARVARIPRAIRRRRRMLRSGSTDQPGFEASASTICAVVSGVSPPGMNTGSPQSPGATAQRPSRSTSRSSSARRSVSSSAVSILPDFAWTSSTDVMSLTSSSVSPDSQTVQQTPSAVRSCGDPRLPPRPTASAAPRRMHRAERRHALHQQRPIRRTNRRVTSREPSLLHRDVDDVERWAGRGMGLPRAVASTSRRWPGPGTCALPGKPAAKRALDGTSNSAQYEPGAPCWRYTWQFAGPLTYVVFPPPTCTAPLEDMSENSAGDIHRPTRSHPSSQSSSGVVCGATRNPTTVPACSVVVARRSPAETLALAPTPAPGTWSEAATRAPTAGPVARPRETPRG
jgi:hypothetical protein